MFSYKFCVDVLVAMTLFEQEAAMTRSGTQHTLILSSGKTFRVSVMFESDFVCMG